jgi:MYXO-CTERM domain-containing protein
MKIRYPFVIAAAALSWPQANAATAVWTSNATGGANWSDGDNWNGDVAPAEGDDIEIGVPVTGGARITNNDLLSSIGTLWLKANLNEVNGNAMTLNGNSVRYTAGGTSIGKIGAALTLTQNTTYDVSATSSNGRLEVGGGISGAFDLIKDVGTGRLRFVGTAKSYTGNTIIKAGILDMSAENMLPSGAGKGSVYIASGAELFINNVNTQINGLNDYNSTAGTVNKGGSNTRSLTLGNGDANGSFSGNMTFTGGSSTVNKVGLGTQVLSGNVTTAGAGTVSGGTLRINGAWSSGMSVSAGGTLQGTGTIGGAVTVTGALSPGASIESLSTGALTMNNGSTFVFEAADNSATGADLLVANGALSLTNVTLDLSGAALQLGSWLMGDKLTLISYTGTPVTSGFAGYGDDSYHLFGSKLWLLNYNDVAPGANFAGEATGTSFVTMTVVPEPGAALLGGFGALALLRRRRN